MTTPRHILVAVEREDAKPLLQARGWTVHEVNGEVVGASEERDSQEIAPEAALCIVFAREARALRTGGLLDIERVSL